MAIIQYQDGTKIEFEGSPTQKDIDEAYNQAKGIKQKGPGFLQRVGGRFAEAAEDIVGGVQEGARLIGEGHEQAKDAGIGGQIKGAFKSIAGAGRAALRTVGGVAGAAFAPITEAPGVHQTLDFVAGQIAKIPGVTDLIQNASELAEQNPEIAKDIQNVVDIAILASSAKVKKPADGKVSKSVQRAGAKLEASGTKAIATEKQSFARRLLRPFQTKKVKEAQVARTTETGRGALKTSTIAPTAAELKAEQAVLKIPGVSSKKTMQQNFNVISTANKKEALALQSSISAKNFPISADDVAVKIKVIKNKLAASPVITGDAEKTASKLLRGFEKFVNQNEKTGSGLLKARKSYDKWVRSQKPSIFDAKAESAFTTANREIRSAFNTLLEEKAPTLGIKESLAQQSALFKAMETLVPKAAKEADTALGRAMQRIGEVLGTKNKVVQVVAASAGIGGLGAAATFAPAAAALGIPVFLVWKGGKFILKPRVRVALGKLLKNAGSKISTADRSVIIGVLNDYAESRED